MVPEIKWELAWRGEVQIKGPTPTNYSQLILSSIEWVRYKQKLL